jgi:hypothetical protein
MYRFDDKTRKRLLEDALVADLLEGPSGQHSTGRGGSAGNVPASPVATAPAQKSSASREGGGLGHRAPVVSRWFSPWG